MGRPSAGNAATTEDEVNDLQRRISLLEGDRKMFYETSQWTIKQNKETLELVKEENKHFKEALALLQRDKASSEKSAGNTVEKLTGEVNELKKRYNELKSIAKLRQNELTKRNDELRDLEREGQRASAENPLARQIRVLENKLEKATMKCNEAAAFRKTYDHIINRLKDEKRHFDVQLQQSMSTLKAKEADLGELIQMSTDAHRAKETSKSELAKLEQTIAEERKIRQKELAERRKLVQSKIEVNQRMEQRERKRRELRLEEAGELNMDGEQNLIKNYVAQGFYSAAAEHELQMQKDKVTTYEEAFRRIKEATGIEDINEVIEKFLTQDETAANLTQLTKEAQSRIEALNEEKGLAKAKVEEMRYSGPGSFGSRRIIDEYDAKLAEANSKCDKNRKRFDKMAKLLVNAKAGIQHLADRLEPVKLPDEKKLEMSDDNVLKIMTDCEHKLERLVQVAMEDIDEDLDAAAGDDSRRGGGDAPNNVRVPLSDNEEDTDDEGAEDGEEEEMPLERDKLKELERNALDKAARKGRAKARKKEGGGGEGKSKTPHPPPSAKPATGRARR